MAKMDEAREAAQAIASGLKQLGPDRKVALSTHKTKALIVALEKKCCRAPRGPLAAQDVPSVRASEDFAARSPSP